VLTKKSKTGRFNNGKVLAESLEYHNMTFRRPQLFSARDARKGQHKQQPLAGPDFQIQWIHCPDKRAMTARSKHNK
jgi:hypothetical protein